MVDLIYRLSAGVPPKDDGTGGNSGSDDWNLKGVVLYKDDAVVAMTSCSASSQYSTFDCGKAVKSTDTSTYWVPDGNAQRPHWIQWTSPSDADEVRIYQHSMNYQNYVTLQWGPSAGAWEHSCVLNFVDADLDQWFSYSISPYFASWSGALDAGCVAGSTLPAP